MFRFGAIERRRTVCRSTPMRVISIILLTFVVVPSAVNVIVVVGAWNCHHNHCPHFGTLSPCLLTKTTTRSLQQYSNFLLLSRTQTTRVTNRFALHRLQTFSSSSIESSSSTSSDSSHFHIVKENRDNIKNDAMAVRVTPSGAFSSESSTSMSNVTQRKLNVNDNDENNNTHSNDDDDDVVDDDGSITTVFGLVAKMAAICLYQSDLRKEAIVKTNQNGGGDGAKSSSRRQQNDAASAQRAVQTAMDQICFQTTTTTTTTNHHHMSSSSSSSMEYRRWFQSIPCPAIIDLSKDMQQHIINVTTTTTMMMDEEIRCSPDFVSRIHCRLLLFPSGTTLSSPLMEPIGTMVFGKLLYGGITRSSVLDDNRQSQQHKQQQRRDNVRTEVKATMYDIIPTWIMYGGAHRMYESVDMGAAAVLEVILYPQGHSQEQQHTVVESENMQLFGVMWNPQSMFSYQPKQSTTKLSSSTSLLSSSPSKSRNDAFRSGIQSTVGGLQPQIDTIVRRVLDGRVIRHVDIDGMPNDVTNEGPSTVALEAKDLELLGLTPVRGLLLYGPPGCGKTALVREISRALRARTPKIVSAPELLDRWVGGSEKLVRQLFADAEAELAACNNDATKSALHVIVIDEIDAVFRKRSSSEDTGEATRSSVVNQILAKLDGVKAINNILVVGMTNRRELLDEALLRPGRLEVQIEIPLPNKEGRREIFNIHFNALRQRGRLSHQLCNAIDGRPELEQQHDARMTKRYRQTFERIIDPIVPVTPTSIFTVATDTITNNIASMTDLLTDNILLASDVTALDAISFPPGAMVTDFARLVRRTILRRRKDRRGSSDGALNMTTISSDHGSKFGQRRRRIRNWIRRIIPSFRVERYDLASDEVSDGFSGADIAGLVRCAGSIALARARKDGNGVDSLLITLEDIKAALKEVRR